MASKKTDRAAKPAIPAKNPISRVENSLSLSTLGSGPLVTTGSGLQSDQKLSLAQEIPVIVTSINLITTAYFARTVMVSPSEEFSAER